MDIPAAAGPWIVLGAVTGVALVALAGLLAVLTLRSRPPRGTPSGSSPPADVPPAGFRDDDLDAFREFPPGTAGATAARALTAESPWPALAPRVDRPADGPAGPVAATVRPDSPARRALIGLSATALLLIAAISVVAALTGPRSGAEGLSAGAPTSAAPSSRPAAASPPTAAPPATALPAEPGPGELAFTSVPLGADGTVASLTFAGLVLERHAVGVTVTYPGVTVTTAGGDGAPALAHVVLPTYNCLGVEAPADPVAAGCVRSTTEYADLPTPGLTVLREDDGLRITGTFPTYTRPNGTPPAWTGRAYALTVTVQPLGERPDADAPAGAPVPAAAVVHLGTDRAESIGAAGLSVLRYRR